jgi:hypothetical protein
MVVVAVVGVVVSEVVITSEGTSSLQETKVRTSYIISSVS